MNILFLSYSIIENDVRTQELLKIMNEIGQVILVSPLISENLDTIKIKEHIKIKLTKREYMKLKNYLKFIFLSIKSALKIKNIDILFVDNYLSAIPALMILKMRKIKFIIQDMRELYLISERKGVFKKLLTKSEIKLMEKSDLVIVANKYRANLVKHLYKLKNKPIVFENIRKLNVNYNSNKFNKKYKFNNEKIRLIYTGGFEIDRKIDKLVEAMKELDNCELYIVGGGSKKDKNILLNIIKNNNLKNVYLYEKLPLDELKYLINNSHIGVVTYNDNTFNNKYCAPGKVYEFLFEGLPVITTENPPLKSLCQNSKIGESDNNFIEGIKKIIDNYQFYKENVNKYIKNTSIEENRKKVINEIKRVINGG